MASPTTAGLIIAAGLNQSVGKWFGEGGGCYFGAAVIGLVAGNYGYNKGMGAGSEGGGSSSSSTSPQRPEWDITLNPNGSYSYNNGIVANNGGNSIIPFNQGGSNSIVIPAVVGSTTTSSIVPCGNSFSADTTVETPDGDMPISEVEIGDTVIGYDEDTGESGEYTVTDTISHEDDQIAYVTINGEEIETTPWHLFYTSDGWVEAGELETGDAIVSLGGVYGLVDSVIVVDATQTMYDLTVEDVHTFAVGDGDWVVHNVNCFRNNAEQFNEQAQQIREQFIGDTVSSNVGIADYSIAGLGSDTLPAVSGGRARNYEGFAEFIPRTEIQNILGQQPFMVDGGGGWFDTEVKILANIARNIQQAGIVNPTGQISLFTERPMCGSCSTMVSAFRHLYPDITINILPGNLPLNG